MEQYRIKPGSKVDLGQWNANDKGGWDKDKAGEETDRLAARMGDLQEILYAEHKHKLLVVLQAIDTGGKDGTVAHVFRSLNPEGVRVASFKVPTSKELDHDYLWRVHAQTPGSGEIVIFNRSHYEEVLIVRVHKLVPEEVWARHYAQINEFERMLAEEGTTILKFYLHIDKDEQKGRLQARLDDPSKNWKFNPDDLKERALWPEYMRAYEAVLEKTSTGWAPWYLVPANHKWFRNLVVASVITDTLEGLHLKYPQPTYDPKTIHIE